MIAYNVKLAGYEFYNEKDTNKQRVMLNCIVQEEIISKDPSGSEIKTGYRVERFSLPASMELIQILVPGEIYGVEVRIGMFNGNREWRPIGLKPVK